ncbi:DUF3144 domain-containing protein [Methylophaga sp.]|uniref:DUF3144 domain-containing protein n=1 Tax=Methylophaga sp. TaxID=2024840 RepID=UPI003F6A12F2
MDDETFFERADAHIYLSNEQISDSISRGKVSASMMYSTARFNAWLSACGFDSAEEMSEHKQEVIDYFMAEYRKMLEENINDYIENYEPYMTPAK